MNQTWSMRDDPANYDDEGNYIGDLDPKTACEDAKRIEEVRDAVEEERYRQALIKLCEKAKKSIIESQEEKK